MQGTIRKILKESAILIILSVVVYNGFVFAVEMQNNMSVN